MADDKELRIKGQADFDQPISETEKLKDSLAGVKDAQAGTAESASAAADAIKTEGVEAGLTAEQLAEKRIAENMASIAAKEHAKDTESVSSALTGAQTAMGGFVRDVMTGGVHAKETFDAATLAVGNLEKEVKAAQAAGPPVNPQTVALLKTYKDALAAGVSELDQHTKATDRSRSGNILWRAGAQASVDALGTFGRALGTLSTDMTSWVGVLARAAIPLAALAGAAIALEKTFTALKDRGVEVTSFSDVLGKVMDSLAVSLGGTTKASMEAEKAFRAQQDATRDLDETSRLYQTGLDLLNAVEADVTLTTELFGKAAVLTAADLQNMSVASQSSAETGKKALHDFNQGLNDIAITSPATAAAFQTAFKAIAAQATHDFDGAVIALRKLIAEEKVHAEESRATIAELAENYGKTGPAAIGKFTAAAAAAAERWDKLRETLTAEQAFAKMRGDLEAVALAATKYGGSLASLDPKIAAAAALALMLTKTYSDNAAEVEKVGAATDKTTQKFHEIADALADGTRRFDDRKAAITALAPQIEALIASIEKQAGKEGELEAAQRNQIGTLRELLLEIGRSDETHNKSQEALDKYIKKVADVQIALDKNAKAFAENTAKIEEHRQKAVEASDAELAKVVANTAIEVATLNKALADRVISQTEYNTRINTLFAELAQAKAAAYEKERADNEAARVAQEDLVAKDTIAKTILLRNRDELNASAAVMKLALEDLIKSQKDSVVELQKQQELEGKAKAALDIHAGAQRDLTKDVKATRDAFAGEGGANAALDSHLHRHAALQSPAIGVPATGKALEELGVKFGTSVGAIVPLTGALGGLLQQLGLITVAANSAGAALDRLAGAGSGGGEGGGWTQEAPTEVY